MKMIAEKVKETNNLKKSDANLKESKSLDLANIKNEETSSNISTEELMDDNDEIKELNQKTHNLFNEETLVAENDMLKVYVVQAFFKRQKKFHLQDHQYIMHFKKKTEKPILLSSVLDILEKAFFVVLENLKSFYKTDEENYVYMTLTQDNLFNPFRTSPYVLQSNDTKQMVNHLMVNFNRFINSNNSLPLLERSFCVFFKVLSGAHINDSNHRRKAIPIRHTVGMSRISKIFLAGGLISLPQSYLAINPLPQNCLPSSIAFGNLQFYDPDKYQKIKKMFYLKSKKTDKIEASTFLYKLTEELCQKSKVEIHGPHELSEVCLKMAECLNIQIHVILSMDGPTPSFMSFPPGNNKNLHRLYLKVENDHVNLVDNLRTFFSHHKRSICFDCKVFFSNHWRKTHRCRKSLCCFNCRGILLTEETIVDKNETIVLCDSKISKNQISNLTCSKCNLNFYTKMCYQNHEKLCASNSLGWKCPDCGVFESGINQTTNEELIAKHVCGIKIYKCMFCYSTKNVNHVCQIKKQLPHDIWPNMCFLHMAFKDESCGNCNNCYLIRKTYAEENKLTLSELFKNKVYSDLMCQAHKNNNKNASPNIINIFKEEEDRHSFQEYLFCDDEINNCTLEKQNVLRFPYSTKKPKLSKEPCKMKKTRQTVAIDFHQRVEKTFNQKKIKTAMDKFMMFLCHSDTFSNYVIIVNEARGLMALLESILKLNLIPNIIQDGNQVNLIEIPSLKLKFLYNGNYLKGTVSELAQQYGVPFETYYFPNSWNRPCNYNYKGRVPSVEDYYLFSDSTEEKLQKDEFYKTIEEPWCMQDALIKNTRLQCQTFTLCCLSFVTQCFELQELLQKKKPEKKGEIHPYGWRITSLSGFTFAVFSYFFMNDFEMYSVMNPFSGNVTHTSQGEYEWTRCQFYQRFVRVYFLQKYFWLSVAFLCKKHARTTLLKLTTVG